MVSADSGPGSFRASYASCCGRRNISSDRKVMLCYKQALLFESLRYVYRGTQVDNHSLNGLIWRLVTTKRHELLKFRNVFLTFLRLKCMVGWVSVMVENRRFGGIYRLHLQDRKVCRARNLKLSGGIYGGFLLDPQHRGSRFLRNAGAHLYGVTRQKRQEFTRAGHWSLS
jgi:hypothetical protein